VVVGAGDRFYTKVWDVIGTARIREGLDGVLQARLIIKLWVWDGGGGPDSVRVQLRASDWLLALRSICVNKSVNTGR
jgi:hypothetical protein